MHKITPLDLCGKSGYTGGLSARSRFCWRYFDRDGESYRVLTIEDEPSSFNGEDKGFGCVRPRDFNACLGYRDSISSTCFNWRWYERDGVRYRVLTIEDGGEEHTGVSSVSVRDLAVKQNCGFYDGLGGLDFNWRWLKRDGESFRVVTIERSE